MSFDTGNSPRRGIDVAIEPSKIPGGLNICQQSASNRGKFSLFKGKITDSELQNSDFSKNSPPNLASLVFWWPINFIRRNRWLYRLAKSVRLLKRNGIKEITKMAHSSRRPLSSLETEAKLAESERLLQKNTVFPRQIKISVIVPLCNTQEKFLAEMIESVMAQTYSNWELCLADGSDKENEGVKRVCISYAEKDNRIKYEKLDKNLGIAGNSNKAIEMSSGEYMGILDHNDVLHPSALYEVMKAICCENADFVYTDEAIFSQNRIITSKYHKPDYAVDTLCSCNYISNFTVFSRKLMGQAGALRTEFEGSHDYDLILRYTGIASCIYHIPKLLYFRRNRKKSVGSANKYDAENVIEEYLKKRCIPAKVENKEGLSGFYRVNYELVERPKVSIIIPNRDNVTLLRNCLSSITEKTSYDNYEIIIVENNSKKAVTFAYYEELKQNKAINIVHWEGNGFNYSEICNFGAQYATGKQLVFLNNDIVVITPGWIEEMLMYSQRNDVGMVGIKLLFLNGTIQHAGVILGMGGIAGHVYLGAPRDAQGYMMKLQIVQNVSAVSAACIMIRKSVFEEVGFLDPEFSNSYNDIDLCLKVRKAGYLIVWTPYAEAYHLESKTRGYETTLYNKSLLAHETDLFRTKWEEELNAGDPYFNCNFSLNKLDYSFR